MDRIGSGLPVSFSDVTSVRGRAAVVSALPDTMALLARDDLAETIVCVSRPIVTLLAPVMEEIGAILCTTGGPAAHVAIVARDLDLPCLMQCQFDLDVDDLDDATLVITSDGVVYRET